MFSEGALFHSLLANLFPVGIEPIASSTYASEVAPPRQRAAIIGIQGCLRSCGYTVASWIGYASSFQTSGQGTWRLPLAMQIPVGVILFFGTFFVPYSPRWLIKQGRFEEGLNNLILFHSKEGRDYATKEYVQIKEQIALEDSQMVELGSFGAVRSLFSKQYRRRLGWVIFVMVAQGLTGASIAAAYQSILFGNLGISGHSLLLVSACYGFMGPTFSLLNIFFIADKWGRKETCWAGCFSLSIDLAVIMTITGLFATNKGDTHAESIAAVAFIFLFSGLFSISFENTPAVVCTEILPFFLRGTGFSIGYLAASCVAIVIQEVSPIIFNDISWKYYGVYVATNMICAIIYFMWFPETKGRSLEEMEELFGGQIATKHLEDINVEDVEVVYADKSKDVVQHMENV